MAITSQPFVQFTSFNFWLVGPDALYHCSLVGVAQTPSNRRNTAAASFWHPWLLGAFIIHKIMHFYIYYTFLGFIVWQAN